MFFIALSELAVCGQEASAHLKHADAQLKMAAAKPVLAAPANNGQGPLDGFYLMTRFWMNSGLEIASYWFRGGTVVKDPIGSGQTLDIEAERASHASDVMPYRVAGGQLTIGAQQAKLEPDKNGCFNWDTGIFCPVEVFKIGTIDGTFEGGASVGGGAVMSSTAITFKRDGTYSRDSVASFSSKGTKSTVSDGSTGSELGKYRIDGTALHLIPDGGKETVISTFPYDDGTAGPAPRRMYFSGGMLTRVK